MRQHVCPAEELTRFSETHLQVTHPVRTLGFDARLGLLSTIPGVPDIFDTTIEHILAVALNRRFRVQEDICITFTAILRAELASRSHYRGDFHDVRDLSQKILT